MKRKLFLLLCALLTMIGVQAQSWTGNAPVADGTFLLYNVEAQKFINNGDPNQTWGTNAYLQAGFGMDIKLEAAGGAFNLNTNVSNGGDSHYLATSTWCDGDATPWTFTAVAGQTNTYTISNGGSYLVANDALNDVEYKASTDDAKSWWKLVSLDDFKAAMAAKAYSDTDPMDVSVFIQGRSFARNDGRNSSWTLTVSDVNKRKWIEGSDGTKENGSGKYYGNEVYDQLFELEQTLTGLPNGVYEVRCSGFGTNGTTYIYGNNTSRPLTSENSAASGSRHTAYKKIADNNEWSGQTSGAFFVSDGNLTIGLKRETNTSADWCVYDEFRLYYYGPYSDGMDVTGLFITNPSFETGNTTGWTYETSNDHGAKSTTNDTYKMSGSAGDYLFNIWSAGNPISQTLKNLPAGTYKLTAVMGTDANQTFQLTMGDAISSATSVDKGTGVEVAAYCELGALSDLTISATTVNNYFYKVDNFKLYYNPTMPDLEAVEGTMDSDIRTAQTNAVNTYNSNKTPANYYAALTAIANAEASIHEYAQGAAINALITEAAGNYPVAVTSAVTNAACSSSFSGKPLDWTCTNSNAFQVNTWSTEGNSDGSGMTTPFIENWVGSTQTLGAGSIRHTSIKNLTAGFYEVGVHARVYRNTNVDITDGAFRLITDVDEKSIDLNTGSSCNYGTSLYGRYKVYKKVIEVGKNGSLNIGFDMGDSRNFSWLCFKDLTVRYMGPTMSAGVQTVNYADDNYVLSGKRFELTFEGATVEYELNGTPTANVSDGDGFSEDVPLVLNGSANGFYFDFPEGMEAATEYTLSIDADVISHDDEDDEYDGSNTAVNLSLQTPLVLDGTYYIKTADNRYVSRGNNFNTRAIVDNYGIAVNLSLQEKTGEMTFTFIDNGKRLFDSGSQNVYTDNTSNSYWKLSAATGGYNIINANNNGSENYKLLVIANGDANYKYDYLMSNNDNGTVFTFETPSNHAAQMTNVKNAQAAAVATAIGQSSITTKAELDAYTESLTSFSLPSAYAVNTRSSGGEIFEDTGDVYQTLTNVPNGLYKVSVSAFQRIVGHAATYTAYTGGYDWPVTSLYANSQEVNVRGMFDQDVTTTEKRNDKDVQYGDYYYPDNTTGAAAAITAGNYANEIYVNVTDNTLRFGIYKAAKVKNSDWLYYKDFAVTGYTNATLPTSITIANTEVVSGTPKTLMPVIAPAEAASSPVVWSSSDENVVSVNTFTGEITAMAPGDATITATSIYDSSVSGSCTVTASITPEYDYTGYNKSFEKDGTTYYLSSTNLIKNGSFEYPNPVACWTTGTGSVNPMSTSNFNVPTEGAAVGTHYLQATASQGGADAHSINTSWALENGKSYVFGYKIKANQNCTTNLGYIGTSLSNTKGNENTGKKFETPSYGTDWKDVTYFIDNSENFKFVVFNARWMANAQSFDGFYLAEVIGSETSSGDTKTVDGEVTEDYTVIPSATTPIVDISGATFDGELSADFSSNANGFIIATAAQKATLGGVKNVVVDNTCDNLVLTDGVEAVIPAALTTATTATYSRTIGASTNFGTICVPFALESNDDIQYYTVKSISDGVLTLVETSTVDAGVPAVYKKKGAYAEATNIVIESSDADVEDNAGTQGETVQLIGTFTGLTVGDKDDTEGTAANGNYYIGTDNRFYQGANYITVNPFRAYITGSGENAARLTIQIEDENGTTSIVALEEFENENNLKDGKYLIDGKIVIVKNGVMYSTNGQKLN